MEQDQTVLQAIQGQLISDPRKCALAWSVYEEFQESSEFSSICIDYDESVDEIYLAVTRNGRSLVCIPRSYEDSVDLIVLEHFRKKLIPGLEAPHS